MVAAGAECLASAYTHRSLGKFFLGGRQDKQWAKLRKYAARVKKRPREVAALVVVGVRMGSVGACCGAFSLASRNPVRRPLAGRGLASGRVGRGLP